MELLKGEHSITLKCMNLINVFYGSAPAAVTEPEGVELKERIFSQLKSLLYSVDKQIMISGLSMDIDEEARHKV